MSIEWEGCLEASHSHVSTQSSSTCFHRVAPAVDRQHFELRARDGVQQCLWNGACGLRTQRHSIRTRGLSRCCKRTLLCS